MFKILKKIISVGIVTENIVEDGSFAELGKQVKTKLGKSFSGSIAIREVDTGSCNGCELEVHAINNAFYDAERYGINFVPSPRHADILLVTGPVSKHMEDALRRAYNATPDPKWVIAMGECAINGGIFGENYATVGSVAKVIPVDLTIPGCPPTPTKLLQGILTLLNQHNKTKKK